MKLFANRYERKGTLGGGRYGTVWLAFDRNLQIDVALKVLKTGAAIDDAVYEASTLMSLQGPNILPVLDADIYQDLPYVVTPVVPGGSVARRCKDLGVPSTRAVSWARALLVGMDVCHRHRLLHRDIRVNNLFLRADEEGLLGDFGLAHVMDERGTAPPDGHWSIRAPECYSDNEMTVRSEVYSAGIALLEMLAGSNPLHRASEALTQAAASARDVGRVRDIVPHIPRVLAMRIEKATAFDAKDRYESAMGFHRALGELSDASIDWQKIIPHAAHHSCWKGSSRTGRSDMNVCVIPNAAGFEIRTLKGVAERRVRDLCLRAHARDLPTRLRQVFDSLA